MAKAANSLSSDRYKFQYAVKFICTSNIPGTSQTTDAFLPGSYQTAVNIHNPNDIVAKYRKKLASPLGISKFINDALKPDAVERVVCAQVKDFDVHPIHGFEGFLVIESMVSLDVTAVYTAGKGEVQSIAVEQIKERKL